MAETLGYRCPVCGGELEFESEIQKMFCKYCDNSFEVEQLSKKDDEFEKEETKKKNEWLEEELEGMFVYRCSHCNGEVVGDETLGASTCPYCDMPVVMVNQFRGDLKPEYIIPFKLKKEEAVKKLQQFCSGKKLLPDAFTKNNRIESIKGMYVPFWLFDCKTTSNNTYAATRVRSWSDSKFRYTETKYYQLIRQGTVEFQRVPVDGSTKMDNTYMQSVEPFDYKDMVDFQSAYMAGYLADRYDVNDEEAQKDATTRITNTTNSMFIEQARVGYNSCNVESSNINCEYTNKSYVMLPVWILSTNYNGEIFTFMMNGQTGKFIGKLPIDKKKYRKYFTSITAGVTLACSAISLLLMWIL